MTIQYFKASWGDIKNSPGWFGKLCLLALLNFIPIFGQIVSFGYLYGWAREIAWGTHEPLPSRIFANEDGKMYRRGWFALVLSWVFMLVPYIVLAIGEAMQGSGVSLTFFGTKVGHASVATSGFAWIGAIIGFIGWLGIFFVGILIWIGNMRIAIYDRLSAGFQLSKVWKMFRHDTGGIMRIFGMELLFSFIIGIILSIVFTILIAIVVSVGISGLVGAGYSLDMLQSLSEAQAMRVTAQFFASAGLVGFIAIIVGMFVAGVSMLFIQMLVIRAMGYWTMQFDVPRWGGQDEPLPFEQGGSQQPQAAQPVPPQSAPYASSQNMPPQAAAPINPASPHASTFPTQPTTPSPGDAPFNSSSDMPRVEYTEPAIVNADFFMPPDEVGTTPEDAERKSE